MEQSVEHILQKVMEAVQGVPGVVGVVLGGSRARGTHKPDSDVDIGIYYDERAGFSVEHLSEAAARLDDDGRKNLITPLGGWGPWVNAGGWLVVKGYHVDLILRDLNRVAEEIQACSEGRVTINYQTGHPHGYLNAMYMGEVAICQILHDPMGRIAALKAKTRPYPETLKAAMVGYFLFEAEFSCMFVQKSIDQDDLPYLCGHFFRSTSCLNQVIFALNEEYCLNEKRAVDIIETFPKKPATYKARLDQAFSLLSSDPDKSRKAAEILYELIEETKTLVSPPHR